MHIVRVIGGLPDHFNGTSTQELKSKLAATVHQFWNIPGHRRAFALDVKNMFTELPYDAIATAANQGSALYTGTCDITAWNVHLRRRYRLRGPPRPPQCIRTAMPPLVPALLFELLHTFVKVGTQVRRRPRGAAMGGYISPAMAMVCIANGAFPPCPPRATANQPHRRFQVCR